MKSMNSNRLILKSQSEIIAWNEVYLEGLDYSEKHWSTSNQKNQDMMSWFF